MDVDGLGEVQQSWPRVVSDEVYMSKAISSIGLLGSRLQEVRVFPEMSAKEYIPAYTTDTFESLKKQGVYVIDVKNSESSTWKGPHKVFKNLEDSEKIENWKPVLELLVKDIAKLFYYNIPMSTDSYNLAVVKGANGYKIRYFGFDYSLKNRGLDRCSIETKSFYEQEGLSADIDQFFKRAVEEVLWREYGEPYCLPKKASETIENVKAAYSADILKEVRRLSSSQKVEDLASTYRPNP